MSINTAYDKAYLEGVCNVTKTAFSCLVESNYDFFDAVDAYMQTSEIRQKMDAGNWSALMKGHKQLLNSIDYANCKPNIENEDKIDMIMYRWIADIYVYLQWMYNLPSKAISLRVNARELYRIFTPLHETSIKNACEKIFNKYKLGELYEN